MPALMHADEVPIDETLVRRLLAAQFPAWADLPLARVPSAGTDNALFRLGEELFVRLPRIAWAVGQVAKEQHWLPRLARDLPLPVPTPLAAGLPGEGYPWPWSVYTWLPGEPVTPKALGHSHHAAADLAAFIAALHQIDPAGGPTPGEGNSGRGVPLADRDTRVRAAIAELGGLIDPAAVTAEWEAALAAPVWDRPGVWIHGDLAPSNLLATGGRISAVIDFGCLGVGDPACDLLVAWNFLTRETRQTFRRALSVDDATWQRGRGWALSVALIAYPYYLHTNPTLVASARRVLAALLAEE
jgi:aminoglycoside phosphotransferase (APT) family kinase protein